MMSHQGLKYSGTGGVSNLHSGFLSTGDRFWRWEILDRWGFPPPRLLMSPRGTGWPKREIVGGRGGEGRAAVKHRCRKRGGGNVLNEEKGEGQCFATGKRMGGPVGGGHLCVVQLEIVGQRGGKLTGRQGIHAGGVPSHLPRLSEVARGTDHKNIMVGGGREGWCGVRGFANVVDTGKARRELDPGSRKGDLFKRPSWLC